MTKAQAVRGRPTCTSTKSYQCHCSLSRKYNLLTQISSQFLERKPDFVALEWQKAQAVKGADQHAHLQSLTNAIAHCLECIIARLAACSISVC